MRTTSPTSPPEVSAASDDAPAPPFAEDLGELPRRRRLSRAVVLRLALIAAVAASLIFAIASQWSKLPAIEWHFRPGWLALSLAGLLAFEWMHIELWRGMLHTMGGKLPRWKGRSIWATTLLARYVPTSVLMAVGRVTLSEKEGVPKRVTTASVVYEVALTFTAAVVISTYLVLTLPAFEEHASRWLVLLVPIAGIAAMHPRIFHPLADFGLRRIGSEPLPVSLSFGRVLYYLGFFLLSFVVAGFAVLAMTLALHSVDPADYAAVVASYSLGFAAGVIGFLLPGALGAREAGVVVAVAAAVPAAVALAVALVLRLVQVGVELGYAAVMSLVARRQTQV